MKRQTFSLFSVALVCSIIPIAHAQNLLINGSFEQPNITVNYFGSGSDGLPGWSIGGTGTIGLIQDKTYGDIPYAPDGIQQLIFNPGGTPPGMFIDQTFSTVPGSEYELTFMLGRYAGDDNIALRAEMFSSSNDLLATTDAGPAGADGYGSAQVLDFFATDYSTRLQLTDISSSPSFFTDLLLDNVQVYTISVPEPTSISCLVLGGLVLVAHRRLPIIKR